MLELIKKNIFSKFESTDNRGLFFSGFDENGKLLFSNGVISSDKKLGDLVDTLYYGIVEKNIKSTKLVVADVVGDVVTLTTPNDILSTDTKLYGFLLSSIDGQKSGLLLPDTYGVADAKNALYLIKQKYGLDGKVIVNRFSTTRILIS